MSMFCGLPVIVATLPMLDAVATASRCGSAFTPSRLVAVRTKGTITRQMMSLTKKADRIPLVNMTVGNRCCGFRRVTTSSVIQSKNPAWCR